MPIDFTAFVDEVEKISKVVTTLQPHQQRVVDRILQEDQPGLVVAHGLGSGKTLTSISAQDALGLPADVVVPASLRANFQKELDKHHVGKRYKTEIDSVQNVATKMKILKRDMLIVDEAHRLRDPASKSQQVISKNEAKKRLLLTGSPFYNHPADIAALVDIAAGEPLLPKDRTAFEKKYITEERTNPGFIQRLQGVKPGSRLVMNQKESKALGKILQKWVDYHEGSTDNFPSVTREDVHVPMSVEQLSQYDALMGKAPAWVKHKVKNNLPPSKSESKMLNAFLGAVRQISNTTQPFQVKGQAHDPKIQRAYDELKKTLDSNPRAKAVVYSNYLEAGINPYKKRLIEGGIPFGEFTGQMPKKQRDALVRDYNESKIRALLLSSAGGEGLDLKGTRLLQILEPHWNDEKLHQVEGRGIRYKSHEGLPAGEQNVHVQRYLSTRPQSGLLEKIKLKKPGFGVDEYLTGLSGDKERLNEQFRGLLRPSKK